MLGTKGFNWLSCLGCQRMLLVRVGFLGPGYYRGLVRFSFVDCNGSAKFYFGIKNTTNANCIEFIFHIVSNLFCALMSVSMPLSPPSLKYTRFAILDVTFVNREAGSTRISIFAVDLKTLNGVQSVI